MGVLNSVASGRRHDTGYRQVGDHHSTATQPVLQAPKDKNSIKCAPHWYGSDLKKLGSLLDRFPNMYTEIEPLLLLSWDDSHVQQRHF